jgi:hypothetical protein
MIIVGYKQTSLKKSRAVEKSLRICRSYIMAQTQILPLSGVAGQN